MSASARWWLPALARLSPALAGRSALRLFGTPPPPRPVSERAREVLARAERLHLDVGGTPVPTWVWGSGPTVHLVHGWGGRASQLTSFVDPLVARGLRVVAFDAPGHGESPVRETSLFELADVLRALVTLGGGRARAIVGHSLGAAAAVHALDRGLSAERLVLVAPPADPARYLTGFLARLGAPPEMVSSVRRTFASRHGLQRPDLPLAERGARVRVPLLVVHDRQDDDSPWQSGAAIARAWPRARLLTTDGLGHHRVLRDAAVVDAVASFAGGDPLESIAEAPPSSISGICEAAGCARAVVDDGLCLEHLLAFEAAHPHTRWAA